MVRWPRRAPRTEGGWGSFLGRGHCECKGPGGGPGSECAENIKAQGLEQTEQKNYDCFLISLSLVSHIPQRASPRSLSQSETEVVNKGSHTAVMLLELVPRCPVLTSLHILLPVPDQCLSHSKCSVCPNVSVTAFTSGSVLGLLGNCVGGGFIGPRNCPH